MGLAAAACSSERRARADALADVGLAAACTDRRVLADVGFGEACNSKSDTLALAPVLGTSMNYVPRNNRTHRRPSRGAMLE